MARRKRIVHLPPASYDLLLQETKRRGVDPDALTDGLLRADLGASAGDLQSALAGLAGLAGLRTRLPDIDGVTLARTARTELEHRST